jgi:DNA-binding transcriptional MerR regulator
MSTNKHASEETMNLKQSDQMLTGEVSRLAEVVPATVRLWEKQGKLTAIRTASGVRLFSRADVEAVLKNRRSIKG